MRLAYVGFVKLRTGRIHLICPRCGRKQSNMPRQRMDPDRAVLVSTTCERCSAGSKGSDQTFRDVNGHELCSYCGRSRCERAGGTWGCNEQLVKAELAFLG